MEMDYKRDNNKERLGSPFRASATGWKQGSGGFIADSEVVYGGARKSTARMVRDGIM